MQTGDRVNFVEAVTLPASPNDATFYHISNTDDLYLGNTKLCNDSPEIVARLEATVGHSNKNLLDITKYTANTNVSNIQINETTGSLSYTGTGTHVTVSFYAADFGVEMYGKTYTVSCINNLASTAGGRLAIRKANTNQIVTRVGFDSTGKKSITFTPDVETFPNGWYISVMATGSTSTTGKIDISNLMIREAFISNDTFEPYIEPTDSLIETKARAYLNSTVGHACKNLYQITVDTQTINGVTYTVDKTAGTITANGTSPSNAEGSLTQLFVVTPQIAGKKYFSVSLNQTGSSTTFDAYLYDQTAHKFVTKWNGSTRSPFICGTESQEVLLIEGHTVEYTCRIFKGQTVSNLIYKPMIWPGDIDDDTFEPYQEPTDNLIETKARAYLNSTVGHACKNLLDLKEYNIDANGITYTVNESNGTVTANGTATAQSRISFHFSIPSGNYYFSGCPTGGSNTKYDLYVWDNTTSARPKKWDGVTSSTSDFGNTSQEIKIAEGHTFDLTIRIQSGVTVSNLVFKPMIRDGSIADDSFEPYQEPTDSLIETKTRAYLNSTVGHACKNLLDLTKYSASSNVTNIVINHETGSVSANASGSWQTVYFIDENIKIENGKTYVVSCMNNVVNASGKLAIRNRVTNVIYKFVKFDTVGVKSITFTPNTTDFPNGWTISLFITDVSGTAGNIDISELMMREVSISDDTFDPYVTPTDEKKQDKPLRLAFPGSDTAVIWDIANLYKEFFVIVQRSDSKNMSILLSSGFLGDYILPDGQSKITINLVMDSTHTHSGYKFTVSTQSQSETYIILKIDGVPA